MPIIRDYTVSSFLKGLVNSVESQSIPKGAASDILNWQVLGDRIALRRGMVLLGADAGIGEVTGLGTGKTAAGDDRLFRTRGRKIEYYDESLATPAWTELGTNSLPAGADGEDIAITKYFSLAGASVFLSSPNSSIYQIKTANPTDLIDLSSTTYRGKIRAYKGSMFLWDRKDTTGGRDKTGFYRSKLDKDEVGDYTAITGESLGTGNGIVLTFTGTLSFKSGQPKRSCFGLVITDGVETFTDDYSGNLVGSAGGTGTINYATGAFSITFAVAPANLAAITGNYYWENPTSGGIADFAKSATRVAAEGFVIRQDDGGDAIQNLFIYDTVSYWIHSRNAWAFTLSADDLTPDNQLFREKAGIPNWRAGVETGDGIYYLESFGEKGPEVRLLTLEKISTKVIPRTISIDLDLTSYEFDQAAMFEWDKYICLACREKTADKNNRVFMYHRDWKTWELHSFEVSVFESLNGALVGGDSVTNNVWELFSGLADDEANIMNRWRSGKLILDADALKTCNDLILEGLIQPDQKLKVSLAIDGGQFAEVGGSDDGSGNHTYAIQGDGSYVDRGSSVAIGGQTLGKKAIGAVNTITAYNFSKKITIDTDRFHYIELMFEAQEIGYVSVSKFVFHNIHYKGKHLPIKYQ